MICATDILRRLSAIAAAALLCFARCLIADSLPAVTIKAAPASSPSAFGEAAESAFAFPGQCDFLLSPPPQGWTSVSGISFTVELPSNAPPAQVLIFVQDWDYFWYQQLLPGRATPGSLKVFSADFSPEAAGWEPRGHHGAWHYRVLMSPQKVGIKLFSEEAGAGSTRLANVKAVQRRDSGPPTIRNVRTSARSVPRYSRFEITCDLPDRYTNPFDEEQVALYAEFKTPSGRIVRVDGFYACDFYRQVKADGDELYPQGRPSWRARFAPSELGRHSFTLHARDRFGSASWGPGEFEVVPSSSPGFARVSKKDPRFFEFDDGSPFFPIGHNIRSPFDSRMDQIFKWKQRWEEGSSAYERYFKAMGANGENLTEIWSAAWSLGLEWTPRWRGYHGIGQYNMMNAWEMDNVLASAEANRILINYVVHNHGKFGTLDDKEWEHNPFNAANGGYLALPEEYFTDPRAIKSFRSLMRYIISRWSHSTSIFAWELWSELDLTGSNKDGIPNYRRPEVVDWHRLMGRAIKDMDPYDHMITTHVCTDYTRQNVQIVALPEIDFAALDAYHSSPDPLHIVPLMIQTAEFNNQFGKPVLVTEFGGSPFASGIKHLHDTLHAALWASPAIALGGCPMFWWWQLIEEENFYPMFASLARFMNGEDRRGTNMVMTVPSLTLNSAPAAGFAVRCLQSNEKAYGWIFCSDFDSVDDDDPPSGGIVLTLQQMSEGSFDVEFWNTVEGKPVASIVVPSSEHILTVDVPAFTRDIAFKARKRR